MKCGWYEQWLANEGAELWRNGRPSAALLEHARECETCDRTVQRELHLKLMFTELTEQSRAFEPGEAVKGNLLAQLDAMQPQSVPRASWIPRFAIVAAAVACLVLALVIARHVSSPKTVAKALVEMPVPKVAPRPPQNTVATPVVASVKPSMRKVTQGVDPTNAAQRVMPNDFYPVVMCDSATCSGPTVTVRVELPSSPLSARGSRSEPVMADLLVGEDGLVRGVRLLQ